MEVDIGQVVVGMDLGQLQDYTAISVLRLIESTRDVTVGDSPDRRYGAFDKFISFSLIHIERFQSGYIEALDRVQAVMDHPDIMLDQKELVLDVTGLGQPVLEMAWQRGIETEAIVITGGESPHYADGKYFVPRTELISGLVSVYQAERIKISADLEIKQLLIDELMSLQVKKRPSGEETYETAKSTQHDDLVMSLAMPIWLTEQRHTQERITTDAYERYNANDRQGWIDRSGLIRKNDGIDHSGLTRRQV